MSGRRELADAEMLALLDARERGESAVSVGRRMGMTRAAVCGHWHRIDKAAVPDAEGLAPDNRDGGAGPEWLARGLAAQARRGGQ